MADLSITAGSVLHDDTTTTAEGIAGATITAGQTVYIDTSDSNKLKLADANSATASVVAGIAMHGASAGQKLRYATGGSVTIGATTGVGTVYVQSATAGGIALGCPGTTDLASTMYTTIIGVGTSATKIRLLLFNSGALVP